VFNKWLQRRPNCNYYIVVSAIKLENESSESQA